MRFLCFHLSRTLYSFWTDIRCSWSWESIRLRVWVTWIGNHEFSLCLGEGEFCTSFDLSLLLCLLTSFPLSFFLLITVSPHLRKRKRRVKRVPVTTRTLVWALRLRKRPSKATTSTKSAHSPVTSPSEVGSCPASSSLPKWTAPSSSAWITCTSSKSTRDTKRDTPTLPRIFLQRFDARKATRLSSASADRCPRLFDSTSWKSFRRVRLRGKALLRTKKSVTVDFIRVIS